MIPGGGVRFDFILSSESQVVSVVPPPRKAITVGKNRYCSISFRGGFALRLIFVPVTLRSRSECISVRRTVRSFRGGRFDDEYFLQPQDNATGSSNTDHHPRGAHHDGGGGREADEAPAAEREGVGEINNAVTPDARRGGTEVLRRDNDDETITTSKEQMAEAKDLVSSERSTLESSLKGGVEGESTMVETAVTPGRGNGNTGNASHNGIDRNEHVDSELLPGARGDTRSERGDGVFLDGVASKSWVSSKRPRKEGDGQAP